MDGISLELTPATISVFTRHAPDCSKKSNRYERRCKCRKWLYIFEGGKAHRVSAGTRSWEQAQIRAQAERERRDPVKRRLQEIQEREDQKAALTKTKNITVSEATHRWLKSQKSGSKETIVIYDRAARRINAWAEDQKIESLADVSADMLDLWRGEWSKDAEKKYNRIDITSQSHFQGYLKRFFRYTVRIGLISTNPAQELRPIAKSDKRTQVLTQTQFRELLEAIPKYTESQPVTWMVHDFAAEFRALFLLQRWTGLRILDCLMLPRTALVGNNLAARTKKTGAKVDCDLPDEAAQALLALSPRRERFLPDYFLWNREVSGGKGIKWETLSTKWGNFINQMNDYLDFKDVQGNRMGFHSHMLRDTYAVEMLLAGVPLEDVSRLLTHTSIKTTEDYYGHWVPDRLTRLKNRAKEAMIKMGATFTVE
jgi:integrase/recombinase XerD